MTRFILMLVGGVALLSALYLGFVKFAFAPDEPEVAVVVDRPASVPERPAAASRPPLTTRPAATPRAAPPPPRVQPSADTSAADTAAVRRLTVELAERTRRVAHVGKPVARHVARDGLGLDDTGCTTTDGVRLCLVASAVGGWQIVGTSGGYAVTARGPEALGDPLTVRANG